MMRTVGWWMLNVGCWTGVGRRGARVGTSRSGRLLVVLAILCTTSGRCVFGAAGAAEPTPEAEATTEALRAAILGDDEAAADGWVQLNAHGRLSRWSDVVIAAQQLLTRQPPVLIGYSEDESLYWPARRVIADLTQEHPALHEAYRQRHDPDARALLSEYQRTHRIETLQQLLDRFPFVSQRGEALELLADGYLDREEFGRAAEAFAELRESEPTAAPEDAAVWACKELSALLRAGRLEQVTRRSRAVRRQFGAVVLDRHKPRLRVSEFLDHLEEETTRRRYHASTTGFLPESLRSAKGWTFDFRSRPLTAAFRRNHPERVPPYQPAARDGVVYASDGNELRAFGVDDGRERWRWLPARPQRFSVQGTHGWLGRLAPAVLRPAVSDRRVLFLRPIELAETVHSICCVERTDGRLVWQRIAWSEEHEGVETAPVAHGEDAFVVVSTINPGQPERTAVDRRAVVSFRVDTGEPLWRTPLPRPSEKATVRVPGSVSGPVVTETSVLIIEDWGAAYCFDRTTGRPQWARILESPPEDWKGRPGGGWCAATEDRVCLVSAGSSRVACVDLRSGRQLWSEDVSAPVSWMAAEGKRLFVAADVMKALSMADGKEVWRAKAAEPPIGPGCLAGEFVLVPTAPALHVYKAEDGQLTERRPWPLKRPMTRLTTGSDGVVGMIGDTVCKFGTIGPAADEPGSSATAVAEALVLGPEELAAALFATARFGESRDDVGPLPGVGQPLSASPAHWVVFDAAAGKLRCFAAATPNRPLWEVPLSGQVRSIDFDDLFAYVVCADRLEIRDMPDGELRFSRETRASAKPQFTDGRVLWTHERDEGGRRRTYLAGYHARRDWGFQIAVEDLGLQRVLASFWEDDAVYLLGDKPGGQRAFLAATLQGHQLRIEKQIAADSRIRSIKSGRDPWIVFDRKIAAFVNETQSIYCYDLSNGSRVWKCQLDRNGRPLIHWRRVGFYLLWCRGSRKEAGDSYVGVTDLLTGERLRRVNGQDATIHGSRLCSVGESATRAYDLHGERLLGERRYSKDANKPVWIQSFGEHVIVALADGGGVIREAAVHSPDFGGHLPKTQREYSARTTEIQFHERPIVIDGWTADWDHVRTSWQDIDSWVPALDRSGRARPGERSADDLAARWRACYDETALYLLVRVRDDRIEANRWSDCPWVGDSIELALTGVAFGRNLPVFSLALEGPGQSWASGRPLPADLVGVRYDPLERHILYEIALPWAWLADMEIKRQQVDMNAGYSHLFFALLVHDDDGEGLEGSLEWGAGLAETWNPSDWRILRFRSFNMR